ncbi:hypothetical protein [Poriferisphaera sp. WC338]|uniref:hypothetical protein n=1 Tax=Poriferisphaera sp. WC338 TaxID=3425129 RepID=UPI003D813A1E
MQQKLDDMMEQASTLLMQGDYPDSEQMCEQALTLARESKDWDYYARILLPLQEVRRQRRMTAADGEVVLGTTSNNLNRLEAWAEQAKAGCIMVSGEVKREGAHQLLKYTRDRKLNVEVLFGEHDQTNNSWNLWSVGEIDAKVHCRVDELPGAWQERRWTSLDVPEEGTSKYANAPAGWFLYACEQLGDAAIAQTQEPMGTPQRVLELEKYLHEVGDHEKLHEALAEAARAAAKSRN